MDYTQTKLYGISNKKYLAEILHLDKAKLRDVSEGYTPIRFESEVNGKTRILYDQQPNYKNILKRIVNLLYKIELPKYTFGGIRKRSYVDNAKVHKDNKFLLLLDISNFFPTTSDSFVYNFFYNKLRMQPDIAKILTNLVTVPREKGEGRYLPQGFPTSPIMSFLAYADMYEKIAEIAEINGLEFSCYYDDLTFSSNKFISKGLKKSISRIIRKYGFNVHPKKSRLTIKKYTKVTGVILEDGNIKAPKILLKKLHEVFNDMEKMDKQAENYSLEDCISICNKGQGLIAAIKSIEPNKKLDMYINRLNYIRNKYDIPYRRNKVVIQMKN